MMNIIHTASWSWPGRNKPTAIVSVLVLAVALIVWSPWNSSTAGAANKAAMFMGFASTQVTSLNPDSWAIGGDSPLIDVTLEGEADLSALKSGRTSRLLRNSTIRWVASDDFTDYLAWLDLPEDTRGNQPCGLRQSGNGTVTAPNGDQIFFDAVWGESCLGPGSFSLTGTWTVTGGTGVFDGVSGVIESKGIGGNGAAHEFVFGWINH